MKKRIERLKVFLFRKKRIEMLIALFLVIAILSAGGYAYFSDSKTVSVSFDAASLKLDEVTVVPDTLGNEIKPGDFDSFTVNIVNKGSIPGNYIVVVNDPSGFLIFEETTISGVIESEETLPIIFNWEIPFETDMGTGGQNIEVGISVRLDQIVP